VNWVKLVKRWGSVANSLELFNGLSISMKEGEGFDKLNYSLIEDSAPWG
jgi:hypothetical protein